MKNPFREIKERKVAENLRSAEEQRQREERLRQLEETANDGQRFRILHPIKAVQNKKEMKRLREEIDAYEMKKKSTKTSISLIGVMVVCFGIIVIMSAKEKIGSSREISPAPSSIVLETNDGDVIKYAEKTPSDGNSVQMETSTPTKDNPLAANEAIEPEATLPDESTEPDTILPEETELETTPSEDTTDMTSNTSKTEEPDIPHLTVDELSVSTLNDYGHIDTDILYLGNDEGVTITVKAPAIGLTADDLLVIYDENLLSVKTKEPYESDNKTYFTYYVTGKKVCETQLYIGTTYDYLTLGDLADGYLLDVKKLDYFEGRVCYVTPSGDKYHFSELCAGENAIKTTYRDVVAYEYEPCGKCAK